jgi:PST family polysaccharide transporter
MNGERLARIAIRSTLWVSIGNYSSILIGFVSTLLLTRLIRPEIFGFFSMSIFWSTLLNLRSKSGLNYASIQHAETNGKLLGTFYVLDLIAAFGSLALSIIGALLLFLASGIIEIALSVVILTSVDTISSLVGPLSMVLEKELQLSRLTLVTLVASTIAYATAILLALVGGGIWSLLSVNIITTLISIIGVYWVCKRRLPQTFHVRWEFDKSLARKLLRVGLPTGLSLTTQGSIVTQFDNFLIGTFVGYTTLGFYDRAYRIAHWPNLLLSMIVSRVGFLTFAKVQNDLPRLTHAVRLSIWLLLILGIPIALVLCFGAQDIVRILYGDAWSESATFLPYLVVYSLTWPLISLAFWLSVALGHTRITVTITAVQALTLVLFGTLLTIQWGVMGTILGVGITMLFAFILSCWYIFRQIPISVLEIFGAPLLSGCVAVGILLITNQMQEFVQLGPLAKLIITTSISFAVFLGVLLTVQYAETVKRIEYVLQRLGGNFQV